MSRNGRFDLPSLASLPDLQAVSPVARAIEYNPVARLVVTLTALVPWLCYGTVLELSRLRSRSPVARKMEYNLVARLVETLTALVPGLCSGTALLPDQLILNRINLKHTIKSGKIPRTGPVPFLR